jgi:Short C-terminal domain
MVAGLQQLADLRESGALSEKEFSAAKTKLLAS